MTYKPDNVKFNVRWRKTGTRDARLSMRLPAVVLRQLNEIARKENVSATHVVETLVRQQYTRGAPNGKAGA